MPLLTGFTLLLLCQVAGEGAARLLLAGLAWRLPGPVLGLLLLALLLAWPAFTRRFGTALGTAADALLAHLSLLFVPIGVGVVAHLALLGEHAAAIVAVLLLSTWIGIAVTALVLRALWREGADGKGA